jgi:hypothetical protein
MRHWKEVTSSPAFHMYVENTNFYWYFNKALEIWIKQLGRVGLSMLSTFSIYYI